jgi:hypothetical protein
VAGSRGVGFWGSVTAWAKLKTQSSGWWWTECLLPVLPEDALSLACPDETVSGPRGRPLSCVTEQPGPASVSEPPASRAPLAQETI